MPKDPKRNIPSYQLEGGHLNEFEFQKSQSKMAEEPELPFTADTNKAGPTQAKRIAKVAAEAHRKVEKRKKRRVLNAGGRQSISAAKRSSKRVARKRATKTPARAGTKKQANVKRRQRAAANR